MVVRHWLDFRQGVACFVEIGVPSYFSLFFKFIFMYLFIKFFTLFTALGFCIHFLFCLFFFPNLFYVSSDITGLKQKTKKNLLILLIEFNCVIKYILI